MPLYTQWITLKPSRKGIDKAITFESAGRNVAINGYDVEPVRDMSGALFRRARRVVPRTRNSSASLQLTSL